LPPLDARETAELALAFCLLWFFANWSVNASLSYTTVASATIVSSTSGFFNLAIGRIFRVEKLTAMKIGAVFTCFLGVVLVSLSDSAEPGNTANETLLEAGPPDASEWARFISSSAISATSEFMAKPLIGDTLALVSALFYASYVILLKVRIENEERINMQLFFGFVGLFNIMLITWSSDYLYVFAMLKTTPLVVTVGLSLTIPAAVLGDSILGVPVHVQVLIGAALPKERRSRTVVHESSAKIHKRTFAVQDNAVEHVEIGSAADVPADDILASLDARAAPQEVLTKKEKQTQKREAFLQKLGASRLPYSKSHERRQKRKAKEQLVGDLNEMQTILSTIAAAEDNASDEPVKTHGKDPNLMDADQKPEVKSKPQNRGAKIGEGKAAPLSKNQRQRALQLERFRQPLIRSNPEFANNPFQTIRTHAQNTLIKHRTPN
ncbi:hypothetical protein AGABI2DRAFT_61007, partial [Agaricus bisporus var. bisporus H97]|uniref:hypothetical protein n=1 Tax=Agaricus bisporus var. bisporus (strain H97 / ATCC MYA-4626 / FGSC 10389) TaxID=936046 RepID=UPI00029F6AC4